MANRVEKKSYGMDIRVDAWAAQGAARRMCASQDLGIVFDIGKDDAPYTDGQSIHIDRPSQYFSKQDLTMWWCKLIHETRHNTKRGKQCFDVMKRFDLDSKDLYGGLFNLFEDGVVDNIDRGKYLGQDEASSWGHSEIIKSIFSSKKGTASLWTAPAGTLDEAHKALATSLLMDSMARAQYMPDMLGVPEILLNNPDLNPEVRDTLKKAMERGWLEGLTALQADPEGNTADDVFTWVKDYVEDMYDLPPPPPEQDPDKGEGEAGEGDSKGKPGDEEGQGAAEAEGEGELDPDGKLKSTDYLFKEFERDTHESMSIRTCGSSANPQSVSYEQSSKRYSEVTPDRFAIADFHRKKFTTPTGGRHSSGESFEDWHAQIIRRGNTYRRDYAQIKVRDSLAQEVKRHIQSETRQKVTRNRKKGKLDQRKLFKLGVEEAGSDWQERVFWTKENKMTVDNTVVSLLMDNSGSMGGDKVASAIHAMDLIGDVCQTIGVDYEMAGFTTNGSSSWPLHLLYKPFGVKMLRSQIVENMLTGTAHMGGNADGENIRYAYNRVLAQQAKRRILVVLSDGYPSSGGGDISWFTEQVTKTIQDQGLVELHGIGIMDDAVKNYYDSYDVLNSTEELESTLLSVLKHNVLRLARK